MHFNAKDTKRLLLPTSHCKKHTKKCNFVAATTLGAINHPLFFFLKDKSGAHLLLVPVLDHSSCPLSFHPPLCLWVSVRSSVHLIGAVAAASSGGGGCEIVDARFALFGGRRGCSLFSSSKNTPKKSPPTPAAQAQPPS